MARHVRKVPIGEVAGSSTTLYIALVDYLGNWLWAVVDRTTFRRTLD